MKKIRYAVIILNYNTAEDCYLAVESIRKAATCKEYRICIVDGGSTKEDEKSKLKKLEAEDVEVLLLDNNVGYAKGNNEGIKYLSDKYDFQYTVIMNPDVIIEEVGTIEGLIESLCRRGESVVGAQPLVAGMDTDIPADMQVNIRKVFTYSDMLINSSWILKRIFKNRYKGSLYLQERPYTKEILFEVPSGAFFVIKTDVFKQIGFFDEETFLYGEELILGYKLKQMGKKFVLVPKFKVLHYQGKSTQAHKGKTTKKTEDFAMNSKDIYFRKYLKVNTSMIKIYKLCYFLSRKSQKVEDGIIKILKFIRKNEV